MDVHAPHEPIHSWRDFLLHLLTITVGLLIALGLEAVVENVHHRHIVREARDNLRREFVQNEAAAREDLGNLQTNMDNMKTDIDTIRKFARDPDSHAHYTLKFDFEWSSFNQSAWISAHDSGALTYMPTDEVQRYADAYNEQEVVSGQTIPIFTQEVELGAPFMIHTDGEKPTPEEFHTLMYNCALTYTRLNTLHQIVEQLDKQYVDTLKGWK